MNGEGKRFRFSEIGFSEWLTIAAFVAASATLVALHPKPKGCLGLTLNAAQQCRLAMNHVAQAMKFHVAEYGEYPRGNADAILAALCGRVPGKRAWLDLGTNSLDENGAFVDPWRTTYEIGTNQTNGLSIRSAGPNRRFGDIDDLEQAL